MTAKRRRVAACTAAALLVAACDDSPDAITPTAAVRPPAPAAASAPPVPAARIGALSAGGNTHFASYSHSCAVVNGGIQCWGSGEGGEIGDGLMALRSPLPIEVVPAGGGATAVAAGGVHTCAVVNAGVQCWGSNVWAQVGRQRPFLVAVPRPVEGLPEPARLVAAGRNHSCATAGDGLWCWGKNRHGQVGIPKCRNPIRLKKCRVRPVQVEGLAGEVSALALGREHSCALAGGVVQCWGANERGQLGDGSTAERSLPAPVRGISGEVTALAAGADHTCAVTAGRVQCWGANGHGQLGDGSVEDRLEAAATLGLPGEVHALAAGAHHSCAASGSAVSCWGDGGEGQLDGVPGARVNPRPRAVPGLPGDVGALAAGADHSCAVRAGERVLCWGDNDFGQLGSGDAPVDHRGAVSPLRWDDGRIRDRDGDGRFAVACLGDSNTRWFANQPRSWCELLRERSPGERWRVVNRGEGGATAVDFGSLVIADEHLDYALENDAVDAVILAYGTNDILTSEAEAAEVADAYTRLRRRARAGGVDVFVALTPPVQPAHKEINDKIVALNELLAERFPSSRLIDFWSGMEPEDYVDSVHLGASGHAKRAAVAWNALAAAAGTAEAP